MFKSYYGLSCNPFDKQNLKERDCFLSHDHKEMTSRLDYLKDIRGIGVFTARPGMGKSYALRCFAASLSTNLYQMEYFCLSTISVTEFYRQLCTCLGIDTGGGKTAMFKGLQERIYYLYKEKRKPLIVAIDELCSSAHNSSYAVYIFMRSLSYKASKYQYLGYYHSA